MQDPTNTTGLAAANQTATQNLKDLVGKYSPPEPLLVGPRAGMGSARETLKIHLFKYDYPTYDPQRVHSGETKDSSGSVQHNCACWLWEMYNEWAGTPAGGFKATGRKVYAGFEINGYGGSPSTYCPAKPSCSEDGTVVLRAFPPNPTPTPARFVSQAELEDDRRSYQNFSNAKDVFEKMLEQVRSFHAAASH